MEIGVITMIAPDLLTRIAKKYNSKIIASSPHGKGYAYKIEVSDIGIGLMIARHALHFESEMKTK